MSELFLTVARAGAYTLSMPAGEPSLFDDPPPRRRSTRRGVTAGGPAAPLSVSEVTARISGELSGLGSLRIEGELSGIKRAASGHVYFDLKDSGARISCVVWRSQVARAVAFRPKEGDSVIASGKLDVYAPRGNYSLVVTKLEPVGVGALLAKLEALKAELRDRGWFERNRSLPPHPRCVGVVTSRDGAALRDFLRTRSLRWPGHPVRLAHAPVQGPGCSENLALALRRLAATGVDVIVLMRGGGSLEDLWGFNEEPILRAIHECPVPVVSAVGHETDVTLCDHVADHRAHTPTDAAQLVLPDREALLDELERARDHLARAVDRRIEAASERLGRALAARVLRDPSWILGQRVERLESAAARTRSSLALHLSGAGERLSGSCDRLERNSPRARVGQLERRLERGALRLVSLIPPRLDRADSLVARLAAKLETISPLAVLGRGYSVVRDAQGRAVKRSASLAAGDRLTVRFAKGEADVTVDETRALPGPSEESD